MIDSGITKSLVRIFWFSLCFCLAPEVSAASYEFVSLENVFSKPSQTVTIQPYAIILKSSLEPYTGLPQTNQDALQGQFVYQTKVKTKGRTYYRMVLGDFSSATEAKATLMTLKPIYLDAWVYQRSALEREQLRAQLNIGNGNRTTESGINQPTETGERLLATARQEFLNENYSRVIAITEKIVAEHWNAESTENLPLIRETLELAGTTRERQAEIAGTGGERMARFSQAVVLYETVLDTDPPAQVATRISNRLEGIRTMGLNPRAQLAAQDPELEEDAWNYRGSLYQYYQNNIIQGLDEEDDGPESVSSVVVTNVGLQVERGTESEVWAIGLDAGLINDLEESDENSTVSTAFLSYTTDDLRLVGGRQSRTVSGVNQRFDGLSYKHTSWADYQFTLATGYLVESLYEDIDTEHPFIAANISFTPYSSLDVDLFFVNQEISGLTDRRSVGSEVQYRWDAGYAYTLVDYDVFYEDLNNIMLISNFRLNEKWDFNLNLSYGYSPSLSTVNALYGQTASSIEQLTKTLSNDQIYQLARDRTSRAANLYFGSTYQIDVDRQLYFDLSVFSLDETDTSDGVLKTPQTNDVQLSMDYSVNGYFWDDDYTSLGFKIRNSDQSESQSAHLRSRFPGYLGLIYDPRFRLERRQVKDTGVDQYILNPSLKMIYRATKQLNFETDLGVEYSDLDLPELNRQIAYTVYMGYTYAF